jgi:DNA replication protein DnaC
MEKAQPNEFTEAVKNICAVSVESEDYIKDGLLYCGKCNTPKQRRLKGEAKLEFGEIIGVECSCERKKREGIEQRIADNELRIRREDAVKRGWIQSGYLLNRFERDREANCKISKALRRYADNFPDMYQKGIGIMLYGDVGVGKTFYASCIANAVFDKGYSVLIDTYANLCNRIQDFGDERNFILYAIRHASLVVLDDFGAERSTDYVQEKGFTLIDERVKAKTPMIITTNLRPEDPEISLQQRRIFSRLKESCPVQLEVLHGARGREEIGRDKLDYFNKICGGA